MEVPTSAPPTPAIRLLLPISAHSFVGCALFTLTCSVHHSDLRCRGARTKLLLDGGNFRFARDQTSMGMSLR